jgi:hypothetical protein
MTNTVLIKRSGVANSVPVAGNLSLGELAINYNDGNLFYKNSSGVVTVIASNKFVSVTGNVTGGNINTVGVVSATGNVTGNYFIGNGSQLTGISSGTLTSTVNNFTGNGGSAFGLSVTPSTANLTFINIDGVEQIRSTYTLAGNVITFSSAPASGASIEITTLSGQVVASPSSISSGSSNVTIGASSGNVTVGVNSTSNVAVFATTGEYVTGVVSATGNVTGNYILGNGAFLSGVITSVANINNGTSNVTVVSSGGNVTVGVGGTSNVVVFATTGEYVTGVVSASGNITGGNISTAGNLSFSSTGQRILGDFTNGTQLNRTMIQTITANSNTLVNFIPNGTATIAAVNVLSNSDPTNASLGQIGAYSAADVRISSAIFGTGTYLPMTFYTGGSERARIDTSGIFSVTGSVSVAGNVTANNGMFTTIVNTASFTGAVVSVSGNITGGNLNTTGTLSTSGNIAANNVIATTIVNAASHTGTLVSVTGNITGSQFNGSGAGLSSIPGANVTGTLSIPTSSYAATVSSAAQPNITSVGTLSSISTTGTITSSSGTGIILNATNAGMELGSGTATNTPYIDFHTTGNASVDYDFRIIASGGSNSAVNATGTLQLQGALITATGNVIVAGNITGANVNGGSIIATPGNAYFKSSGADNFTISTFTNTPNPNFNINIGNGAGGIDRNPIYWNIGLSFSGNGRADTGTPDVKIDSAGNVSAVGTIIVNSRGNAIAIQNGAGNAVGNIGSSGTYFNRLFAQATTALYADLAEMYRADADYAPGTVLVFGGDQEVTISTNTHDDRVAGVVSTNPAHVMNAGLSADHAVALALSGRVPVSVIGNIAKGDKIVTSDIPGVARSLDKSQYEPGVVIGKAVENYNSTEIGVIEVVVGRL